MSDHLAIRDAMHSALDDSEVSHIKSSYSDLQQKICEGSVQIEMGNYTVIDKMLETLALAVGGNFLKKIPNALPAIVNK